MTIDQKKKLELDVAILSEKVSNLREENSLLENNSKEAAKKSLKLVEEFEAAEAKMTAKIEELKKLEGDIAKLEIVKTEENAKNDILIKENQRLDNEIKLKEVKDAAIEKKIEESKVKLESVKKETTEAQETLDNKYNSLKDLQTELEIRTSILDKRERTMLEKLRSISNE